LSELALGAYLAAAGRRLVEDAAAHARTRRQFGRPIADFQAVAHPLADAAIQLDAAATLSRVAADRWDEGDGAAPRLAGAAPPGARPAAPRPPRAPGVGRARRPARRPRLPRLAPHPPARGGTARPGPRPRAAARAAGPLGARMAIDLRGALSGLRYERRDAV